MKKLIVLFIIASCALLGTACGGSQAGSVQVSPGPMPPDGNFDGVFQSPAYGRMEFTVEGSSCVGLYEGERHFGRIEGVVNGNLMTFSWTQWNQDLQGKLRESNGKGYFRYIVEKEKGMASTRDVHRIKGEWGYDSDNSGNRWNAVKLNLRAKKILKPHQVDGTTSTMDDAFAASAGFGVSGEEKGTEDTAVEMSDPDEKDEEGADDSLDGLF